VAANRAFCEVKTRVLDHDVRMAWEWVGPVGTAVVGIAGITGTWYAAEGQRSSQTALAAQSHQEQRWHRLREERLRLYGELLGELAAIEAELLRLWANSRVVDATASQLRSQGVDRDAAMRDALASVQSELDQAESMEAYRGLYRVRGQASLIAGSSVRHAATRAVAAAVRVWVVQRWFPPQTTGRSCENLLRLWRRRRQRS
jgi:hypothetical protein